MNRSNHPTKAVAGTLDTHHFREASGPGYQAGMSERVIRVAGTSVPTQAHAWVPPVATRTAIPGSRPMHRIGRHLHR